MPIALQKGGNVSSPDKVREVLAPLDSTVAVNGMLVNVTLPAALSNTMPTLAHVGDMPLVAPWAHCNAPKTPVLRLMAVLKFTTCIKINSPPVVLPGLLAASYVNTIR